MESPIVYSRRGGASVGSGYGTWPFGKIEIAPGVVTVKLMWSSRTLRVADALRVESLGFWGHQGGSGVRIYYRAKYWEEYVDFYGAQREVLAELRNAGFNVVEKSGS